MIQVEFFLFLVLCIMLLLWSITFQIAKLIYKFKSRKKWIEFVTIVKVFISLTKKFHTDVRHLVLYQKTLYHNKTNFWHKLCTIFKESKNVKIKSKGRLA